MDNDRYPKTKLSVLLVILCLYVYHFIVCSQSSLPDFSLFFTDSDMNANVRWAESIIEQGPLNPQPYHSYPDWMRSIAPLETWVSWYGNPATYERSPLYAYLLALILKLTGSLLMVHFLQMILGVLLCYSIGELASEVTNNRIVGLVALIISGLYSPFYAFAWPFLRDLLGWLLISIFALLLLRWWRSWKEPEGPSRNLSINLGIVLALGLLARETFYAFAVIVILACSGKAFRVHRYRPLIYVLLAFSISISPLIIRNAMCGTSLLSTSNRFSEAFIMFNAPSASGTDFAIPFEMKYILDQSGGAPLAVIAETMNLYEDNWLWLIKKLRNKIIALLDPYESPDNINIYYMQLVSPVVRYGFPHWVVIVPGIYGLILSLLKRNDRWVWFWILFFCLFANIVLFSPISRFRQALSIFWIPWAAYYLFYMFSQYSRRYLVGFLQLSIGFALCLYLSPQRTAEQIYRPAEFSLSAEIYEAQGSPDKAKEQVDLYRKLLHNDKK